MTKKQLIAGALSMTAVMVSGQIPDLNPIQMSNGFSAYIPAAFSADKKPMLTFLHENAVTLYDYSLQQASTVNIHQPGSTVNSSHVFEWRDFITSWTTETKSLMAENIALSDVEERIIDDAKASTIQSIKNGKETIFISDADANVYQRLYDVWAGGEYRKGIIPSTWYLFTPSASNAQSGSLFKVSGSGTPSFTILPELHTDIIEGGGDYRNSLMTLVYVSYDENSTNNTAPVYLTQTLFNSDKGCEYLRRTMSTTRIPADFFVLPGYEYPEGVVGQYVSNRSFTNGFEIVSEQGTVLQTVNFPENLQLRENTTDGTILTIGGNTYLNFSVHTSEGNEYKSYELLYRVDPSHAGVRSVGAPIPSTSVYPTTLKRGTTLNVISGADARCSVYDLNGRLRYATNVAADSPAAVPTADFAPGMNIVNISSSGESTSTKVIVK